MKSIDPKKESGVSGGYSPEDPCFPPFPVPGDYPPEPFGPFPEPIPSPAEPRFPVK